MTQFNILWLYILTGFEIWDNMASIINKKICQVADLKLHKP